MNKKKPFNLYEQALVYGIIHGLNEEEIDTHFVLSKLKNEQGKTNSRSTRCTRCLKRNK